MMAKNHESAPSNRKGFLELYKRFNKVSAFVLAAAGVVLAEPVLLGLAALDVAQAYAVNRYQEWRGKSKSSKEAGKAALIGARGKPAHA